MRFEDITEVINTHYRLTEERKLKFNLLNGMKDGAILFDSAGKVVLSNAAFQDMWDVKPLEKMRAEPVFQQMQMLYQDADYWDKIRFNITGSVAERASLEIIIKREDGMVLRSALQPLSDKSYLLSFVDITELTNQSQDLAASNQLLSQADRFRMDLMNNISYELRTLLMSVVGYGELLHQEQGLNERQSEYSGHIVNASTAVLAILNDILDLASVEAGAVELDYSKIHIKETIATALAGVGERLEEKNITFQIQGENQFPDFEADESRIRQILFKLFSILADIGEANSQATLMLANEDDDVQITLHHKISEEHLQSMLETFRNLEGAAITMRGGLDISMSLIENLVSLHQGQVIKTLDEITHIQTISCVFPHNAQHGKSLYHYKI